MSDKGEEDKKPEVPEHINLKVVGADSNEVHFKIRRTTALKKLMDAYLERTGRAPNTVRFLYDGNRLSGTESPESLDMDEGDSIDAMVEQVGGCCSE